MTDGQEQDFTEEQVRKLKLSQQILDKMEEVRELIRELGDDNLIFYADPNTSAVEEYQAQVMSPDTE